MTAVRLQESAEAIGPRATSRERPGGSHNSGRAELVGRGSTAAALPRTMKPTGRVLVQRLLQLEHGASSDRSIGTHPVARRTCDRAWLRVKANGGAAGTDGMTIAQFPAFARQYWPGASFTPLSRHLSPGAGAAGVHPQTQRGPASPGHPNGPGPCYPTGHRAGADPAL